jgi:hypothetical protein
MNFFYLLCIFILLAFLDIKYGEISNYLYLLFIPLVKLNLFGLLLFILAMLFFKYIEKYIGGADIKVLLIMLCIFDLDVFVKWLMLSCSSALVYMLLKKEKHVAFFPFLAIEYGIVFYFILLNGGN